MAKQKFCPFSNFRWLTGPLAAIASCALGACATPSCAKTGDQPPIELQGTMKSTKVPGELRDHLKIICIEGHAYYYAKWEDFLVKGSSYAVLSPKLEEDGTPSPCVLENPSDPIGEKIRESLEKLERDQ